MGMERRTKRPGVGRRSPVNSELGRKANSKIRRRAGRLVLKRDNSLDILGEGASKLRSRREAGREEWDSIGKRVQDP